MMNKSLRSREQKSSGMDCYGFRAVWSHRRLKRMQCGFGTIFRQNRAGQKKAAETGGL